MAARFVSVWFPHLVADWFVRLQPELKGKPFVVATLERGRKVVMAANALAGAQGIHPGMAVPDARMLCTGLAVLDHKPKLQEQLIRRLAEWSIRFTPHVALDPPDGLFFDASGCAHLWGGELAYLDAIARRLTARGYPPRLAMADTPGAAWAFARYGDGINLIAPGEQHRLLPSLPAQALRLEPATAEKLYKLGLRRIGDFVGMPRASLRRRFGQHILLRLDQALDRISEPLMPVVSVEPFQEFLPCLEPIATRTGIEIALERLLASLCARLAAAQKGLRQARFTGHRIDGKTVQVQIETNRASRNERHLFKLFELKLSSIEPGLGIEAFMLDAPRVDDQTPAQEKLWEGKGGLEDIRLAELIDRIAGRFGSACIRRPLPDAHHWPERTTRLAASLDEQATADWRADQLRPLHVLPTPEAIQVTAPIPDYPPMLFLHRRQRHKIVKADGPERIEAEWWLETGEHRDYYAVEDEHGRRYWIFRLGHYEAGKTVGWFLHGYFA